MAKQCADIKLTGNFDELCFYQMCGEYYVRMKSSLTGKRFWRDAAFKGSRKSCERFAEGNRLASKLYRMIEEEKREYLMFCFLKKRAIQLLKDGKSLIKATEVLIDYLVDFGLLETAEEKNPARQNYSISRIKVALHINVDGDGTDACESG